MTIELWPKLTPAAFKNRGPLILFIQELMYEQMPNQENEIVGKNTRRAAHPTH